MMIKGRSAVRAFILVALLAGCSSQSSATPPGVRIARDVFGYNEKYAASNETIVISGTFARSAGLAALRRAAGRLFLVDEDGVEHSDDRDFPPLDSQGRELYTPNYVSDPTIVARGIELYVDCKGVIVAPMRARFLRILEEELHVLGAVLVSSLT
jgi:hypothetical protein